MPIEDIRESDENIEVITSVPDFSQVKEQILSSGVLIRSAEVTYEPNNVVEVTDRAEASRLLKLMDALDENEDIQNVYANFDIDDNLLED